MHRKTETAKDRGTLHRLVLKSETLSDNPLGDPADRELHVYTPAGWDMETPLPLIVDIVGYTAAGMAHTNWRGFGENVPERLDRLIGSGEMPPAVVAFPDCFTRLGGNQYINSAGMGRYADYLITEVLPMIEGHFACGGTGKRGLFGKSSGGFGALWHGMMHADIWSAIACSAGDCAFEVVYLPDIYAAQRHLTKTGQTPSEFALDFLKQDAPSPDEVKTLMVCAMAATYDPDPDDPAQIRFPVDSHTLRLIPERWQNWMRYDPAVIAQDHLKALASLKGIWIESGTRDEFNMLYGARRIVETLKAANIPHIYEEFDAGHYAIDYRQDRYLPWLAKTLLDDPPTT